MNKENKNKSFIKEKFKLVKNFLIAEEGQFFTITFAIIALLAISLFSLLEMKILTFIVSTIAGLFGLLWRSYNHKKIKKDIYVEYIIHFINSIITVYKINSAETKVIHALLTVLADQIDKIERLLSPKEKVRMGFITKMIYELKPTDPNIVDELTKIKGLIQDFFDTTYDNLDGEEKCP